MVAGAQLRDWDSVRLTWDALREELARAGKRLREHSAFELLAIEAQQFTEDGLTAVDAALTTCTRSTTACVSHRLDAGLQLMMLADNNADEALSKAVIEATSHLLPQTPQQSLTKSTITMIYETTFGHTALAIEAAMRLRTEATAIPHPIVKTQVLRRAAWALRVGGRLESAKELVLNALQITDRLRLHRHSMASLEFLAIVAFDQGDYTQGLRLLDEYRQLERANQTAYSSAVAFCLEARAAYLTGDSTALTLPTSAVLQYLTKSIRRPAQRIMAAITAAALLGGDQNQVRSLLNRFRHGHEMIRSRGLFDFEVGVLTDALNSEDRAAEACLIMRDYLGSSRRDGFPPTAFIRGAAERLQFDHSFTRSE
jgi:hypothetical protein